MLKPKCCFGVVIDGAFDCAAGDAPLRMARVNSAATSVSARDRRTNMGPPPPEAPYVIRFGLLDRRAGGGRTRFGHRAAQRRVVEVDRTVGVGTVEVGITDRVERIGKRR